MKKIYLLFMTFSGFCAHAQLQSGRILVGGTLGVVYNNYSGWSHKSSEFKTSLSPDVGVFVIKKLAVGFRFDYVGFKEKVTWPSAFSYKIRDYVYSPFVRYYLLNYTKPFNIIAGLRYDFYKEIQKTEKGEKFSSNGDGFSITAGPAIFLSPQIALEWLVGYSTKNLKTYQSDNIFTSAGFKLHLGK